MYLRQRAYTLLSLIFFLCLVVGCEPKPAKSRRQLPADLQQQAAATRWNKTVIDSAITLLHSGDVVLRAGIGPDSYILSRLNQRDKTYSHCGIVMVEGGYPFVYHSIGGEDNPDERLRRDSASLFFTTLYNAELAIVRYDYDSTHVAALDTVVQQYYRQRPRFDMKFDLATDDRLYCAEFVYKALNKAMNDTGYIKTSFGMGHRYVGVDDLFLNPHCRILWKVAFK